MPRAVDTSIPVVEVIVGSMTTTVAGSSYYDFDAAKVHSGSPILLLREPSNKYDANAIKVVQLNDEKTQLGHLPRGLSCVLAPLMDAKIIHLEAHIDTTSVAGKGIQICVAVTVYSLLRDVVLGKVSPLSQVHGWVAASPMTWQ
eukprot:TRINITY_DN38477_c0_g1_i1.p1 TRINITY_DN38477_c0_g1~~TRINITY_DN38477_c0_g1_i1.p1  ORF type:complete len:162 (+),score=29.40 TRINITY_DN38477_c0_g1_i1:55-486(+)